MTSVRLIPLTLTLTLILTLILTSPILALHHVPIHRRPVPATRLYAFQTRPWFQRLASSIPASTQPHPLSPFLRPPVRSINSSVPLYSNPIQGSITPLGEYFLTLTFGGQPINVQIDTGSSTMAVPMKQCTTCPAGDHRLDLQTAQGDAFIIPCSASFCVRNACATSCGVCPDVAACCSSHSVDACAFYLQYADRSGASGALVQADVGISSLVTPIVFGAILDETAGFENEAVDGIFGLAYKELACNPSCVTPLFDALVETGKIKHDVFSICTAQEGGMLTLGGSNSNLYQGDLTYVPMQDTHSAPLFYQVEIKGTKINDATVSLPYFTSAIVDSGTTLIVISTRTFNVLRDYFMANFCDVPGLCTSGRRREAVPHPNFPHADEHVHQQTDSTVRQEETWFQPGYCVRLNDEELARLPTISILLRGYTLEVEPQVYMIPHYITQGFHQVLYFCLGISPLRGLESFPNDVIIGDTVLQKYFVEYDREKSRVGFAVAKDCKDDSAVDPASLSTVASAIGGSNSILVDHGVEILYFLFFVVVLYLGWRCVHNADSDAEGYQPIQS